ncbi:MAG: TRAM domain-containing protein, partial [Deltaproteobacteria bacterium]|nr:TRAM domain-containing protein [Deltaproteobacteria bacterium]
DQIYSFKYSPRPGTRAAAYKDLVPEAEKDERLARCQALQDGLGEALLKTQEGRLTELLVTGPSRRGQGEWSGRSPENRIVNFAAPEGVRVGDLCRVRISKALKHSLKGEVLL